MAVQKEQEEQAAQIFTSNWNFSMINDDEEHSIQYKEYLENSSNTITTVLPIEEPEYSLSMGYEHLSTIPETESNKVIKSSVKSLVPILSEYEVTFDDESECDVPTKDESSPVFTNFSNSIFNDNDDFTSSDDESFSNEDVPMEDFKVNLCLQPSIHFFVRWKIFRPIRLTLPSSPIPVEDSDSLREEIDSFTSTDDLLPPGIESDDYDSKGDIHFLEELLVDDFIPLPENESSNFDHHDDLSFSRPPPEPPDVKFLFDFEPNLGDLIAVVINNIDELNEDECFDPRGEEIDVFLNVKDDDYFPFIFVIRFFLPYLIYPKVFPLLLSARSKDTIFDLGISV
nr:hypothetical protein [Tanacetum cinerariifolium]